MQQQNPYPLFAMFSAIVTTRQAYPDSCAFISFGFHFHGRVPQLAKTLDDPQADAFTALLMNRTAV